MEIIFTRIEGWDHSDVAFYTANYSTREKAEFELFLENDFSKHDYEFKKLLAVLKIISNRGAKQYYFKNEGSAEALPKLSASEIQASETHDMGIRLYCIRLNEKVVVLLNGGIKTNQKPQLCKNVSNHFKDANRISDLLTLAIIEKDIDPFDKDCLTNYTIDL